MGRRNACNPIATPPWKDRDTAIGDKSGEDWACSSGDKLANFTQRDTLIRALSITNRSLKLVEYGVAN